ncbi:hypothetical protein ACOMHN_059394 [Nucella lapillus]
MDTGTKASNTVGTGLSRNYCTTTPHQRASSAGRSGTRRQQNSLTTTPTADSNQGSSSPSRVELANRHGRCGRTDDLSQINNGSSVSPLTTSTTRKVEYYRYRSSGTNRCVKTKALDLGTTSTAFGRNCSCSGGGPDKKAVSEDYGEWET